MKDKEFLILQNESMIVKGFRMSSIVDVFDRKIIHIDKNLYDFCKENKNKSIFSIYEKYGVEQSLIVDKYLEYLISKNIAFVGSFKDSKQIKKMNIEWDFPSLISNCVIEHSLNIFQNDEKLIKNLHILKVPAIEYVCFIESLSIKELRVIENIFKNNKYLKSINIIMKYDDGIDDIASFSDFVKYSLFASIIIHSSPIDKINDEKTIIYTTQKIYDFVDCGKIEKEYFLANIEHFSEAKNFNTCLNRKLCINRNGDIKNCPAMKKSFGNIKQDSIEDIVRRDDFLFMGNIRKDEIDVCKDCEYRYVCTDCRCFIKDPQNLYSQPTKCTYNPYIAKWEGEEGYIPVEDCGRYTKDLGFVPNKRKISNINKNLCGN